MLQKIFTKDRRTFRGSNHRLGASKQREAGGFARILRVVYHYALANKHFWPLGCGCSPSPVPIRRQESDFRGLQLTTVRVDMYSRVLGTGTLVIFQNAGRADILETQPVTNERI